MTSFIRIKILLLLLFPAIVSSQREMKKSELSGDFVLVDVNPNGAKMFAAKYKGACIAYNKKSKEFLLYGDANGTDIIYLEKILAGSLHFYPDNIISCEFKDGKVYLTSQVPNKATQVTGVFNWLEEHLVWEKELSFDISEIRVVRAGELIKSGLIGEAISTYDSVEYANSYYDAKEVSIKLLLGSIKVIEDFNTRRKFKDACSLTEKVLGFKGMKWLTDYKSESELKTGIGKGLNGLTYTVLQQYLEGYTRNLLEIKSYDSVIEKVNYYWKYFTNSADLLLNIADAYYAKKDKTKASEFYEKYVSQAKQLKKEKEIPYYVEQRIIK